MAVNDQADELRELVRATDVVDPRPPTLRSLIVVAGGKGGVGTTTIAANLAAMLATLDESTILVDADFQRADATMLCHLTPQRSLIDVLSDRASVQDVLQRHETGLRVLPAAWAPDNPIDVTATLRHRLMKLLTDLDRQATFVVVDAGSQRTAWTSQLWQAASQILLVTTADDVAVMDTYATIKTLAEPSSPTRISTLINFAVDPFAAEEIQRRLENSVRRFLSITLDSAASMIPSRLLEHQQRTGWLGGGLPKSDVKSFFHRLAMTQQIAREDWSPDAAVAPLAIDAEQTPLVGAS